MKCRDRSLVCVSLTVLVTLLGTIAVAQERRGGEVFAADPNPAPRRVEGFATQLVQDGSFEAGTPNPFWSEFSTNFGTPICDASCGLGGGTGPLTGSWWAWFGGIAIFEQGSVSQTIQGGIYDACTLSFWLEIPFSSGNGTDFLEARIGGVRAWSVHESAGPIAIYTEITQDVSGLIDGTPQTLEFFSEISGVPNITNFFIDDVALNCAPPIFGDGFESGDTSAWSSAVP